MQIEGGACKKRVVGISGNIGQFVTNGLDENDSCSYCAYKIEGIFS